MKKKIIIIVCVILVVLVGTGTAGFLYINSKISKVHTVKISKTAKDLGISDNAASSNEKEEDYVNILLLGIDTRDSKLDPGRSDTMMILTIDKKNSKLKLTSIMRDSLVTIDNGTPKQDIINHAFAFGGAELALKTVNQNYETNIKDYVKVDFFGLEKIIDYAGGVDINVSQAEVSQVNDSVSEISKIEKKTPEYIAKSGLQHLNGIQAVGYARIRYVGNADFQRTERQRNVLSQVVEDLLKKSKTNIGEAADNILPYVETSLDKGTIYKLGLYMLTNKPTGIEQLRLPEDGTWTNSEILGHYCLRWDKQPNLDALHNFIEK